MAGFLLNPYVYSTAVAATDPYFYDVSLLLTGDGTNGAQNNTFLDSSTNNFTITRNGNTTQGTFSPYGNLWSNYFDGTGDYLTTSGTGSFNASSGNWTIEAWMYCTSSAQYDTLISGVVGSTARFYCAWLGTTFYLGDGSLNPITFVNKPVNQWFHFACVKNGSTYTVYINGASVGSSTTALGNYTLTSWRIGYYDGTSGYMNGYISNLRITNTAVYTSAFTPSTTPLTAVSGTSLLTCQSNRFIDNSSNNFTLTVNGNTSVQRFSPFNPTAPYSASTIGGSGYFPPGASVGSTAATPLGFTPVSLSGNFTVEYWLYSTQRNSQGECVVGGTLTANQQFGITFDTNKLFIYDGAIKTSTGTINPIGKWTHCAYVRSGSTVTFYINGVASGTATVSATFSITCIGALGNYGAGPLGYLSDVRITTSAVYTSNFTPPTAPLTAISGTSLLTNFTNAGIPDAAMMNNLETVGNAQVSTSVKKYGTGSLYFDGTGDCLISNQPTAANNAFGTGDFTIEGWFYRTASAIQVLIDYRNSNNDAAPVIYLSSDGTPYYFTLGGNQITGGSAVANNQWFHLALCRSGTSTKLFINGNQTGSTYTDSNNYVGYASRPIIAAQIGPTSYFTGYIDDLRITKGYARYTTNFTPPTAALPTY